MKKTPFYELNKPDLDDFYNIEDFNENADKLDSALRNLENEKQNNLTFDQTPTADSNNPVTSGGIFAKYDKSIIIEHDKLVEVADWSADTTFADYPFVAEITVEGATADHVPDVTFNPTDVSTGIFAPVAGSDDGIVKIYASEAPTTDITVLSIVLRKEI